MKTVNSYAAEQRETAEQIYRELARVGHRVFFDRDDLPPADEYQAHIRLAEFNHGRPLPDDNINLVASSREAEPRHR